MPPAYHRPRGDIPFRPGVGYTPRPDETGTREALASLLDAHGVAHALLVQPSGYGFDNSAMLDAMAAAPGRYKAIAVISGEELDRELQGRWPTGAWSAFVSTS